MRVIGARVLVPVRYGTRVVHEAFVALLNTHCPACGVCAVWVEDSAGDYYVGPTHVCVNCHAEGYLWGDTSEGQRADAIKQATQCE